MIWLAWRQHRSQALFGAIALALVGSLLLVTGVHALNVLRSSGLGACAGVISGDCKEVVQSAQRGFFGLLIVAVLLMVGPCLMGVFWGAPLVAREVEHGTHRMVWTQSVTRRRWIGTELWSVLAVTVVASAALAAMTSWWIYPVNATGLRFSQGAFDIQGIVPIGYAVFAVALGTAAGAVMRKTLPAMGITLAGFVVVRASFLQFARLHYLAPLSRTYDAINGSQQPPALTSDWILKSGYIDRAGHFSSGLSIDLSGCQGRDVGQCAEQKVHALGIRGYDLFQPAHRFWLFQGIETAIFVGLAVALLAVTVWWVRRRLS